MKTMGIIGGSTYVSTAEYYNRLNAGLNRRRGGHQTGEIIINSMDFGVSDGFIERGFWEDGAKYLNGKALSLERAGADFIILACNTWHVVADDFMKDVKIPLLHIFDATGEAIQAAKLKKIALVGVKPTMTSKILIEQGKKRFGADIIVPTDEEQDILHNIIHDELSKAMFTENSKAAYLEVFESLRRRGAEGVVLGCTEIPLLVKQADLPDFPMFDTLTLHVEAAITMALSD